MLKTEVLRPLNDSFISMSCVLWVVSCLHSMLCLFVCPDGAFMSSLKSGINHAQAGMTFG